MEITRGVPLPQIEQHMVYYLDANLLNQEMTSEICFSSALEILKEWIKKKVNACTKIYNSLDENLLNGMDVSYGGYRLCSVALNKDICQWAFLLTHPDTGIATRVWETQVILTKSSEAVEICVSVSYTSPQKENDVSEVIYSRPGFIESLADYIGIVQVKLVQKDVWKVNTKDDIDELYELLTSPSRNLPIVVLTCPEWKLWNYSEWAPEYLVNGEKLAVDCFTSCFVVELNYYSAFDWNRKVGLNWAAYDGAIRIFSPHWKPEEENWYIHPLFKKQKIMNWRTDDNNSADAFYRYLRFAIRSGKYVVKEMINQISFSDIYKLKLSEDRKEAKISSKKTIDYMQKIIDELTKEKEKQEKNGCFYYDEWEKANNLNNELKEENFNLKSSNASLIQALSYKGNETILEQAMTIPEDYEEMGEWCERYFPNTICLHSRAQRELKDHDNLYEDSNLVYKCLMVLGIYYPKMKCGEMSQKDFDAKLEQLHVRLTRSASEVTAGLAREQYYVT